MKVTRRTALATTAAAILPGPSLATARPTAPAFDPAAALAAFCDRYDLDHRERYDLATPWWAHGFWYATDGRAAIQIPIARDLSAWPPTWPTRPTRTRPPVAEIFDQAEGLTDWHPWPAQNWTPAGWQECPICYRLRRLGPNVRRCPTCRNRDDDDFRYCRICDDRGFIGGPLCHYCNGAGWVDSKTPSVQRLNAETLIGGHFDALVRRHLPGAWWRLAKTDHNPAAIEVHHRQARAVIMPTLETP